MEPMGSITGDNYENDRRVLLNETTDENIAVFESLYGPQAAQREFAREQPQQIMPQKSLMNPAFNRPGEPNGRLSPPEHFSRQGSAQPRIQDSRNTGFLETDMGEIDDDDLYALITNPNFENMQQFDANYGKGASQKFLEAEQNGAEVGAHDQMNMKGPLSNQALGTNGRLQGNTQGTRQIPQRAMAIPPTMQPRPMRPQQPEPINALATLKPTR